MKTRLLTLLWVVFLISILSPSPAEAACTILGQSFEKSSADYFVLQLELQLTPCTGTGAFSKIYNFPAPFVMSKIEFSVRSNTDGLVVWQTRDEGGFPLHVPLTLQFGVNLQYGRAITSRSINSLVVNVTSSGTGTAEIVIRGTK